MVRWSQYQVHISAALLGLLTLASVLLASSSARADGPGDWPMFHHDPAHTGYNPDETALKPPLRLKWSYTTTGEVVFPSPAVANGLVYVGSADNKVYALDAATGALRWSYTTGGGIASSPAVASGVVYVGSRDGKVYALDATTGALKWSYTTGGLADSSPAVASGVVYVGSYDNKVYALDAATGALRWSYSTGGRVNSSPAVASGVVYVGSQDGKVYALDAATGALNWSYEPLGPFGSLFWLGYLGSSPAVASGVVYVGPSDKKVYALDAATGALRWSYTTGGEVYSSPAVASGVVYVGSSDKKVYALDAATGALKWSYTTGRSVYSSPAVASGVVYVGSTNEGKVYALDAATGALNWSYQPLPVSFGFYLSSSPAVANGVVYVGSFDGKVYAFDAQPPSVPVNVASYQTLASFPISWMVPITWTGTPASSYDVQYRDGASTTWTDLITSTTALSTTFDGQEGHIYGFRARSRTATGSLGDWSEPVSTTVDLTAPTGSLAIEGGSTYGNAITASMTLTATDATSGVSGVAFSNDGTSWSDWQGYAASKSWPLAAGPDGPRTVYARFRDAAGNVSPVYSDTIILDTTAPGAPQPDDGVSGLGNNPRPAFRWPDVTDNLSGLEGYYYKVDGGPESLVVGTAVTLTTQADGSHTFYVRAKDRAANYSPYGSHAFSIKTTLPQAPGINQPLTPTAYDTTVVNGISEQGLIVKLYANGTFLGQTTPREYGIWSFVNVPLSKGANILYATATDAAGNTSLLSTPVVVDRVAVWAAPPAPQASAVISSTGGTVAAGNSVSVTVPAGAFGEEVNLTLTPYAAVSAPGVFGVVSANAYTSITAVSTASGAKVTSFQQPVTITIAYDPAALGSVSEASLQVSYYDEASSSWVALPSLVDTVNHIVSASATHFSVYDAQVSLLTDRVYLPALFKAASGW